MKKKIHWYIASYGLSLLIIIFSIVFLLYKFVFIRNWIDQKAVMQKKIGSIINKVPYEEYFYIQQQKPSTFFTTPAFPSYTEWCHDNRKLCSMIPLQQMYADIQWIGSIQFVWSQESPNKFLWLSKLLDNLSNLAPYWDYPYAFGQLLIPMAKKQAAGESIETINTSWDNAKNLSDRSEKYLCDAELVSTINELDEETFINTYYTPEKKEALRNPCPTYDRPHYAAFNAFYYRKDAKESARNYRISSFTDKSPWLAPIMAALVYWRGWEHLKSATIWYDKYLSLASSLAWENNPDERLVREADESLKKAVFELQLQLITDADNTTNKSCKKSFDCLKNRWYLKNEIQKSYNDICKKGTEQNNLRCTLLTVWLDNKRITLQGDIIYPIFPWGFVFARSDEYDSRWIEWIKTEEENVKANG